MRTAIDFLPLSRGSYANRPIRQTDREQRYILRNFSAKADSQRSIVIGYDDRNDLVGSDAAALNQTIGRPHCGCGFNGRYWIPALTAVEATNCRFRELIL